MRTSLKLVVALLLVAVVALGSVGTWVVMRGFPQREGAARLSGLGADVTVLRDPNGIPQIYANSTHDLFAAQGYVHASERMWQMEVWRRIGAGRLSELFGSSQLDTDAFIRTLGWRRATQRDLEALDADTRAVLKAYADGVNAWLGSHHDLPLPFVLAGLLGAGGGLGGTQPEPWTPLDSLTWQKVQAWSLGGNFDSELFRLLADERLGPKTVDQLFQPYPADAPVIVPTGAAGSGGAGARASTPTAMPVDAAIGHAVTPLEAAGIRDLATRSSALRSVTAAVDPFASVGGGVLGSNSWALAPSRTATGRAMLANDTHLAGPMPSLLYLVGLHCRAVSDGCPYDVAGAGFPGVPGIVLGHNAHIAWGLTNVDPDVEDLFVERLDPGRPDAVLVGGRSVDMAVRNETIRVRGGDPVTIHIRETAHGPVVSDVVDQLKPRDAGGGGLGGSGVVFALRHTATAEADRTFQALLGVQRASDWKSFRDALRDFGAPSQAFIYADVDGHIGVQIPGRIPVRASGDGSRPAPTDGSADWTSYIPFDDLPYRFDPPSGVIVTANNAPVDGRYPGYLGAEWDPGWRAARLLARLGDRHDLNLDDLAQLQTDTTLTRSADLAPVVASAEPASEDGALVKQRITRWADKPTCETESVGCAAYETFEAMLLRWVFDDELGAGTKPDDLARLYVGSAPSRQTLRALLDRPKDPWWSDRSGKDSSTHQPTDRDFAVALALDRAGKALRDSLGEPKGWTWGELHRVTFREQTFGESGIGPIEALFDKGPYPVAGSCDVPDATCGRLAALYPDPYTKDNPTRFDIRAAFDVQGMPAYRLLIDMGDLNGARFIQTTGQSGVPFDAHYGDFIDRWLSGGSVPLPFTREAVDATRSQVLTLTP